MDQRAEGGGADDEVIPETFCLTKVDRRRQDQPHRSQAPLSRRRLVVRSPARGIEPYRYLPIRMSADLAPSLGLHSLPEEGPQHNERVAAVRSRRLSDHRLIRWSPGAERLANSES